MQQFNIVPKAISGLLEYFHCTIDVGAEALWSGHQGARIRHFCKAGSPSDA